MEDETCRSCGQGFEGWCSAPAGLIGRAGSLAGRAHVVCTPTSATVRHSFAPRPVISTAACSARPACCFWSLPTQCLAVSPSQHHVGVGSARVRRAPSRGACLVSSQTRRTTGRGLASFICPGAAASCVAYRSLSLSIVLSPADARVWKRKRAASESVVVPLHTRRILILTSRPSASRAIGCTLRVVVESREWRRAQRKI